MYQQEGTMIKKSGAKKTSGKAPKKSLKKKAVDTPISPEKSAGKKTATRKVTSKAKLKKTPSVKKTGRVHAQKKKAQQPKKITVKREPAPTKAVSRKTIKKTPLTVSRKTSKKPAAAPRKAKKPPIASKSKPAAKKGREVKPKKVKETPGKAARKSKKQIATKKTAQVKTSAQLKTPLKKGIVARPKKKVTEKAQEPEKIEPIKATSKKLPGKKLKTKKSQERKQIRKTEVLREAKKEEKIKEVQELPAIKTDTISAEYPPAELSFPPTPMEILPSEYGENSITLMTVNPYKLFVFWEVRKETLQTFKGVLNLRVYDVTGIDLDTSGAHSSQDSVVSERVGKMYLDAGPAREYIADIGIVYNGIFIGIARSPRISTPGAGVPGEEEFLPEGLDICPRIGY
jgi:hypothetical protein